MKPVIAVDLDGTLAMYNGWKGIEHIGQPIIPMLNRVKKWLAMGHEVVIFTARVGHPGAKPFIEKWLSDVGLPALHITNIKETRFSQMWDDRAIQVIPNRGLMVKETKNET